jgi:hypothetical protein
MRSPTSANNGYARTARLLPFPLACRHSLIKKLAVQMLERAVAIADRERLPGRREHEVLEFEHMELRCRGGVGRYPDQRVAEIFLNIAKDGSAADVNARDSAIAASLALQHGCCLQALRRALTRNADNSAAGMLGKLLDLLATIDEHAS